MIRAIAVPRRRVILLAASKDLAQFSKCPALFGVDPELRVAELVKSCADSASMIESRCAPGLKVLTQMRTGQSAA
ncbi:hypothetical protein AWH04_03775 [Rhodococcus erythropolis]|nr:hypothetical protein AWH04_03775 [Rhodococcus erythropolis]